MRSYETVGSRLKREYGSWEIYGVVNRYQATTGENTADWEDFIFFNLRIVGGGGGGVQTGSTGHRGHLLSYCACPGWLWGWRIIRWNEDWQGNPKYSEKICPSATLSTKNPTWPDPGSNPGRRGGKPATNRLSYGAALRRISACCGEL
jgi:hypothetical protein